MQRRMPEASFITSILQRDSRVRDRNKIPALSADLRFLSCNKRSELTTAWAQEDKNATLARSLVDLLFDPQLRTHE